MCLKESIRQKELTRFCLRQKEDLQSSSVALFVGNLPPNLSQRQYEMLLLEMLGKRKCIYYNKLIFHYNHCYVVLTIFNYIHNSKILLKSVHYSKPIFFKLVFLFSFYFIRLKKIKTLERLKLSRSKINIDIFININIDIFININIDKILIRKYVNI